MGKLKQYLLKKYEDRPDDQLSLEYEEWSDRVELKNLLALDADKEYIKSQDSK